MIPLREAQAQILERVGTLDPVLLPTREALGLVLAEPISSTEEIPPFASSAMDGYAVRAGDTTGASSEAPVRLAVVDELPAGRAPGRAVGHGEAIRIMTGAVFPDGADAVVIVERTRRDGDAVLVETAARTGDNVRPAGGDLRPGQAVFPAGTRCAPAHLGVLASLGLAEVAVYPRARVGVFSTGDELSVGPGALAPGMIRDSNRPMMLALVADAGCTTVDLGVAPDDEATIAGLLEDGFASCDAVVTSGGVSMGEYDFVKTALDRMGALTWWQVAIKPAKPLAFGVVEDVPVFGLPGNPVSANVSFECFARPALLHLMGHRERFRPEVLAVAERAMPRRPDGKLHLDRVWVRYDASADRYVAVRTGAQASNALSAMALANGLALLPDGDGVDEGGEVRVMLLDARPDH